MNKDVLREEYKSQINIDELNCKDNKKDIINSNNLLNEQNTYLQNEARQVLYSSGSLPGIWGFEPLTMDNFSEYGVDNHCAPTCVINMLKYWEDERGVGNLFYNNRYADSFNRLRVLMLQSNLWGTFAYFAYDGTRDYLSDYGLHREEGSDFKTQSGFDWSWITTQINNGNALYIEKTLKDYDGRSGNHCFLGIGYEITSNGDYIRVCDEWDHSISHFIKYEWSNVDYIWYLRW